MEEKLIMEKIRRMRVNKNVTLKVLAEKTGLNLSYLSRIENASSAPPISTLTRIAEGLDIDVSYLLTGDSERSEDNPTIVVSRRKDFSGPFDSEPSTQVLMGGYPFKPLASKKRGKNMQPYILTPGFEIGEFLQHEGEEFLYVLDGRIEFLYGADKFELGQGDSAYFDSQIPHVGRSIGDKKSRVLIILHSYKRF